MNFFTPNCKNEFCEYWRTTKPNFCERTDTGEDPRDCPKYMIIKIHHKDEWVPFDKMAPSDTKVKIVFSVVHGVSTGWCNNTKNQWFFHDCMAPGGGYVVKDVTHWRDFPDAPCLDT